MKISRRVFWKRLAAEFVGLFNEAKGKPQMILKDIGQLPDDIIRQMAPVLSNSNHYHFKNGHLFFKDKESGGFIQAHCFNRNQLIIIDRFNGQKTIHEITRYLARLAVIDENKAFQEVKNLFCLLAKYSICHPKKSHSQK